MGYKTTLEFLYTNTCNQCLTRRTEIRFPRHNVNHSGQMGSPDLYDLAHVAALEPNNLHGLGQAFWVGYVLHNRSCTTSNGGRNLDYLDRDLSVVCNVFETPTHTPPSPKAHRALAHVDLNRPLPLLVSDVDVTGLHDFLSSPSPRGVPLLVVGKPPRVLALEDVPQVLPLSHAPEQPRCF